MSSVLFVCMANICRSPLAETLFRDMVSEEPDEWVVESAGTWALVGEPAAQKSQQVLAERGLDASDHRARSVSLELLNSFNLILTMENGQKEALQFEFPSISERVYTLSEMVGDDFDIRDPIGGPLIDFQATADELERILKEGYPKITQLAKEPD